MRTPMTERQTERTRRFSIFRPGNRPRTLSLPIFGALAALSLAGSLVLAGCENVAGYSPSTLVRVIDASYNAPALNVTVEGTLLAANLGQGTITIYGTFTPSNNAPIKVSNATSGATLTTANATLMASQCSSVLVTDINATYQVTVLEDQATPAPSGHSDYRILNQAPSTGAVDVYFLSGTAPSVFATAKPVITALAVGATSGYVAIPSSTLYMIIAPSGETLNTTSTTIYISQPITLVGGEVRTVLVVDPQLVTQPVQVYVANDGDLGS